MKEKEVDLFVGVAKKYAANRGFRFDPGCENNLRNFLTNSGAVFYSDTQSRTDKIARASDSIMRLVDSMIVIASQPGYYDTGVLHEFTLDASWKEWCQKYKLWPWYTRDGNTNSGVDESLVPPVPLGPIKIYG